MGAAVVGGDVSAADQVLLAVTALGDLQGRPPVLRPAPGPATWWRSPAGSAGRPPATRCCPAASARRCRWSTPTAVRSRRTPGDPGRRAGRDGDDRRLRRPGRRPRPPRRGQRGAHRPAPRRPGAAGPKLRDVSSALNTDPMMWVLGGGDDYALVATFPNEVRLPDSWQVIGMVNEGSGVAGGRPALGARRAPALPLTTATGHCGAGVRRRQNGPVPRWRNRPGSAAGLASGGGLAAGDLAGLQAGGAH